MLHIVIWIIYLVTNISNGKQYVGLTRNFNERKRTHLFPLKHSRSALNNAVRKYGEDSFEFTQIACCRTLDDAHYVEILLIDEMETIVPCGYNISAGGEGGTSVRWSEERKRTLSERTRGKAKSLETRRKMSLSAKGKKKTAEHIENMRKAQLARKVKATPEMLRNLALGRATPFTPERRARMSQSRVGRPQPWSVELGKRLGRYQTKEQLSERARRIFTGRKQTPEQVAKRVESRRATIAKRMTNEDYALRMRDCHRKGAVACNEYKRGLANATVY